MEKGIYPEVSSNVVASAPPLIMRDDIKIEQLKHIMTKVEEIRREMEHYKKLKNRLSFLHAILKYMSLGVIVLSEISSFVILSLLSGGVSIPLIFLFVSIGVGSIKLLMIPISKLGFNKRKNHYNKKYISAQSFLDKISYFLLKANRDGLISDEEIEDFKNMIDTYRDKTSSNLRIDMEKIKENAMKELKKEKGKYLKTLIKKEKENILYDIMSKSGA